MHFTLCNIGSKIPKKYIFFKTITRWTGFASNFETIFTQLKNKTWTIFYCFSFFVLIKIKILQSIFILTIISSNLLSICNFSVIVTEEPLVISLKGAIVFSTFVFLLYLWNVFLNHYIKVYMCIYYIYWMHKGSTKNLLPDTPRPLVHKFNWTIVSQS